MKKLTALALLAISGGAFAFDQYLPVAPNKLEADLEFNYITPTGSYVGTDKVSATGSPNEMAPALQLKYGIIPGLDVEAYVEYDIYNKDAGFGYDDNGDPKAVNGLGRPQLAIKYAHPELGIGGFVNVALPLGSKDIVGDKTPTQIMGGIIYGKTFNQIVVNAFADYQYNTENAAKIKQDAIEAYAQGQFNVTPMVGPYLGVDFLKTLNASMDGTSFDPSIAGYLLTLKPGANLTINDKFAAELTVPVTVMGKNAGTYWGIYVGAYYTFAL